MNEFMDFLYANGRNTIFIDFIHFIDIFYIWNQMTPLQWLYFKVKIEMLMLPKR